MKKARNASVGSYQKRLIVIMSNTTHQSAEGKEVVSAAWIDSGEQCDAVVEEINFNIAYHPSLADILGLMQLWANNGAEHAKKWLKEFKEMTSIEDIDLGWVFS